MNQWKVEPSEGSCKCVDCGKDIADGERKVVVTYGARKNFCLVCGKKHMEEKRALLESMLAEVEHEKPEFDHYEGKENVFGWTDKKGVFRPIIEVTPDGFKVFKQGEGTPVKTVRGKPVMVETTEEQKKLDDVTVQ